MCIRDRSKPDPPQVGQIKFGSVSLNYSTPAHNGCEIFQMLIQSAVSLEGVPVDSLEWNEPVEGCLAGNQLVEGLKSATAYQFRVQAVNKEGAGPWSAPSSRVTTHIPAQVAPTPRSRKELETQLMRQHSGQSKLNRVSEASNEEVRAVPEATPGER
eukprot:TRINITY_DN4562_c0_g1_i1.p1 TRINITY_DN4562_c0_g1~~TRINITY_DN4562_c0_g1_i1.p1  ORF type:complete len:157 (+),score=34.84 TRINITY_DN4562_c0_g1_i1:86-556(+)